MFVWFFFTVNFAENIAEVRKGANEAEDKINDDEAEDRVDSEMGDNEIDDDEVDSEDSGSEYQVSSGDDDDDSSDSSMEVDDNTRGNYKVDIVSDGEDGDDGDDSGEDCDISDDESTNLVKNKYKYSYCLYCEKPQLKLPRHCCRHHTEEIMVAEVMAVSKDDRKAKREKWLYLRNLGNHEHNLLVHKGEASDLIVRKQPSKTAADMLITDYVPCSSCLGYFHRNSLWLHKRNCPHRNRKSAPGENHVKAGRMLIPASHEVSSFLRDVIESMNADKVYFVIKNDPDILKVGENVLNKTNSARKRDKTSEKMRTLGKVLLHARTIDPGIRRARDLINPAFFDNCVQCARSISGYNAETSVYESYSCALRIGFALTDLALVIKNAYIKEQNRAKVCEVDDFLHLRETDWRTNVNACAHRQRQERNWKAPKVLPLTEDCVKFNKYLNRSEEEIKEDIKHEGLSTTLYKQLAAVTLTQLIVFNRRRPREVELLTVCDYIKQISTKKSVHDEVFQSLTIPEKVSLQRMKILMVRGKRGRGVPILIPENIKNSMDILASHNKTKTYLFARAAEDATTPMRAYQVVADLAEAARPKLKHPENIRCTKLRKNLATLSQILNLKKNELEQLANHMGHNVATYREYYRLPDETVLLAKMSKLLFLAQKGRIHEFKGKSLNEISIDPEETLCCESDKDENDEDESDEDAQPETEDSNKHEASTTSSRKHTATSFREKRQGRQYNKWSPDQERFLESQREVEILLKSKRCANKSLCLLVKNRSKGLLDDKLWKDIKNKIHNMNNKSLAQLQKHGK